jgi:hypothetical protein
VLNGTLRIHSIDVESFCGSWLRQRGVRLQPHFTSDLLAYLVSESWRISHDFNPDRCSSFSKWLWSYQERFYIQFLRDTFVDRRYGDDRAEVRDGIAFPASLDAPVAGADDGDGPGRLGDVVAIRDGGGEADSEQVLARLERDRDRCRARDLAVLRQGLSERSAA